MIGGSVAVRRRGLHEAVVGSLGRRIVHGELTPGTALPNESDLSQHLNVSRTVVREAIKVLAAKGLVDPRPKRGTLILPRSHWKVIDPDVLSWQFDSGPDLGFFRDLCEVRALIEPAAARLAAQRRTREDVAAIRRDLDGMDASVDDLDRYVQADMELHARILGASHNQLLSGMNDTIWTALRASRMVTARIPGAPKDAMALHREVVDAIERQDADAAERAMGGLIERAASEIERILGGHAAAAVGVPSARCMTAARLMG